MAGSQYFLGEATDATASSSSAGYAHYWQGMHAPQMMQGSHRVVSVQGSNLIVEIPLSDDLLGNFCKRSRRRFVEIQNATQAQVKLDRVRGCLCVSGDEQSIAAVHKHLEGLGGPRINVKAAVWAELMRTRTVMDSSKAAVAHLQEASGCRIHIERSRQEVRLFGSSESVKIAEQILEELALQCEEVSVPVPANILEHSTKVLEALAHSCAVTFRLDASDGVTVLGTKASVRTAVEELRRYLADPQNCQMSLSQDVPKARYADSSPEQPLGVVTNKMPAAVVEEPKAQQQPRERRGQRQQQPKQHSQQPHFLQQLQQQQLQELQHDLQQLQQQLQQIRHSETPKTPVQEGTQELQQQLQQLQQQLHQIRPQARGSAAQHMNDQRELPVSSWGQEQHTCAASGSCRTCPTCGAGRFCGSCGSLVWQRMPEMSLADWRGGSEHLGRGTSELEHSAASFWPQDTYGGRIPSDSLSAASAGGFLPDECSHDANDNIWLRDSDKQFPYLFPGAAS